MQALTEDFDLTVGGKIHEAINSSTLGHLTLRDLAEVGFNSAELPHIFGLAQRSHLRCLITVNDEVEPPRLAMIDSACHREIFEERTRLGDRIALSQ